MINTLLKFLHRPALCPLRRAYMRRTAACIALSASVLVSGEISPALSAQMGANAPQSFAQAAMPEHAKGEALVTIRIRGERDMSAMSNADIRAAADTVAASVNSRTAEIYFGLSRRTGSILALIKSESMSAEELVSELRSLPDIISAGYNRIMTTEMMPNDTLISGNNNKHFWNMDAIRAPQAWEYTIGRDDIYSVVIDSGVAGHDDLDPNVAWSLAKNMNDANQSVIDVNGHGTHVAGIIGAVGNNGKGVAGIAFGSKIIPIKIVDAEGRTNESAVMKGLEYVIELIGSGVKIAAVNVSFGQYMSMTPQEYTDLEELGNGQYDGKGLLLLSQLPNAPLVTLSAGNEGVKYGTGLGGTYHYPSYLSTYLNNVLSVAAVANMAGGIIAGTYSNYGEEFVDVAAPGGENGSGYGILSAHISGNEYIEMSGTSQAAPHAAGAAVLLASYLEDRGKPWNGSIIKNIITNTANKTKDPYISMSERMTKHGLIDLEAAILSLITKITSISLSIGGADMHDGEAHITLGSNYTVTADVLPEDADNKKLLWESENEDIAVIVSSSDMTAVIRPLAPGSTIIWADAKDGSKKFGKLLVTVDNVEPHEHTRADTMMSDNHFHWYKCTEDDGWEDNKEEHSQSVKTWISDGGEHYRICDICKHEFGRTSHTYSSMGHDATSHWRKCADCGAEEQGSRTAHSGDHYSAGASSDTHSKTCTACGTRFDEKQHDMSYSEYGDVHWQVCSVCGFEDSASSAAHSSDKGFENDDLRHWRICGVCGAKFDEAHHDDNNSAQCTTCGITLPHTIHVWSDDVWSCDEQPPYENHWHVCERCGEKLDEDKHTPEWRHDGEKHFQRCTVCGFEGLRSGHTPNMSTYSRDSLRHWRDCTVCGTAADTESHNFRWQNNAEQHWKLCLTCGYDEAHGEHRFDRNHDEANHWDECIDCGRIINTSAHLDKNTDGVCDACGTDLKKGGSSAANPDNAGSNQSPDSGDTSPAPDNEGASPLPDGEDASPAPDNEGASPLPDSEDASPAPDSGDTSPLPDSGDTPPAPDTGSTDYYYSMPDIYQMTHELSYTAGSSGSGSMVFRSDADVKKFIGIRVDGDDLKTGYYSVSSGSTIVRLSDEYLKLLSEGRHDISIMSTDGKASSSFYITSAQERQGKGRGGTGCSSGLGSAVLFMLSALMLLIRRRAHGPSGQQLGR